MQSINNILNIKKASINTKLTVGLVLIFISLFSINIFIEINMAKNTVFKNTLRNSLEKTSLLAAQLGKPIYDINKDAIKATYEYLVNNDNTSISAFFTIDKTGSIITKYKKESFQTVDIIEPLKEYLDANLKDDKNHEIFIKNDENQILIGTRVYLKGDKHVGYVFIAWDTTSLNIEMSNGIKYRAILLLALFLLLFLFIYIFQCKLILQPIQQIRDVITNTKNGSNQKFIIGDILAREDEIGQLAKSFNEMIFNINSRGAKLQKSEKRINAILDSAVDGIVTMSSSGEIQSINKSCESIFDYNWHDVIGKNISYIIPKLRIGKIEFKNEQNICIGTVNSIHGVKKDGSVIIVSIAISEITFENERIFTGIIRDITKEEETRTDIINAKQKAENANIAKQNFINNISNELREPLNDLINLSTDIASTKLSIKQKNIIDTMHKSTKVLLWIINDIFDFAKIETNELILNPKPFNVREVVTDITETLSVINNKNIPINVIYQSKKCPQFTGDAERIRQIITNLLTNSIKFTNEGYITIYVSCLNKNILRISIEDSGIGIPPNMQHKMYEAFNYVGEVSQLKYSGIGLGLSIVNELVSMMNGSIAMESAENKGTKFTFDLYLQ